MSAFICSPNHVAILATFAARRRRGDAFRYFHGGAWIEPTAAQLFEVLATENARSVAHRYSEEPHPVSPMPKAFKCPLDIDPRAIVRGCDCLCYQSCETPDYKQTEAYAALQAIREIAISMLCAGCEVWTLDGIKPSNVVSLSELMAG